MSIYSKAMEQNNSLENKQEERVSSGHVNIWFTSDQH